MPPGTTPRRPRDDLNSFAGEQNEKLQLLDEQTAPRTRTVLCVVLGLFALLGAAAYFLR